MRTSHQPTLLLVLLAATFAAAVVAAAPTYGDAGALSLRAGWRALLQTNGDGGARTAVILNANTRGEGVFCVNVTSPFEEAKYYASGTEAPAGDDVDALARRICSDYAGAGREIFDKVKAGGYDAKKAAIAAKRSNCSDPSLLPNALTVATIQAQDTLGSMAISAFFQNLVDALEAVGVPACITVVTSDPSGTTIVDETYYKTS